MSKSLPLSIIKTLNINNKTPETTILTGPATPVSNAEAFLNQLEAQQGPQTAALVYQLFQSGPQQGPQPGK